MSDILLEPSEKLESVYCPVYSHPVKLGEYGVQEGFEISTQLWDARTLQIQGQKSLYLH